MPTYTGFAYRQSRNSKAPWIFCFVAPIEGVFSWAGIPRRSDANLSAFQRPEDQKRVAQAKEFFNSSINQSPTTVILGIHKSDSVQFNRGEKIFDGIFHAKLRIEFDDSESLEVIASKLRGSILARLDQSKVEVDQEDEGEADLEEGANADDDSNDEDGDSEVLELGKSVLDRLYNKLDDPEWCNQNADTVRDLAKPATIIDGQHRALAAKACERGMPFSFTALIDCPWEEQVFQFTVVNYTARKIPDQFITANAALSLTKAELDSLEGRLSQAGVKVIEYELMRVVNFDEQSPFYEKINLTEKKSPEKIGYKTMVSVAKRWYTAAPQVFKHILPNLYPAFTGRGSKSKRLEKWREDDWGNFFVDFWASAYMYYKDFPSHANGKLWDVGKSNLMIAVVLLELQEMFFIHLNQQDEDFWDTKGSSTPTVEIREKFRRRGKKFCEYFPPEFLATEWKTKSLNTSTGRRALKDCLEQLMQTKGKYQYTKSMLVTGQTKGT